MRRDDQGCGVALLQPPHALEIRRLLRFRRDVHQQDVAPFDGPLDGRDERQPTPPRVVGGGGVLEVPVVQCDRQSAIAQGGGPIDQVSSRVPMASSGSSLVWLCSSTLTVGIDDRSRSIGAIGSGRATPQRRHHPREGVRLEPREDRGLHVPKRVWPLSRTPVAPDNPPGQSTTPAGGANPAVRDAEPSGDRALPGGWSRSSPFAVSGPP